MNSARPSAIALHAEAAKRLLRALEQQAETARAAVEDENSDAFLAAIGERERILAELDSVVAALTQERIPGRPHERDPAIMSLIAEVALAAAAALESHDQLASHARRERDRVAATLERTRRPDAVAQQYAAAGHAVQPRTLSVTG